MQGLPHQHKFRLDGIGHLPQRRQKAQVQTVGHIQTQTVNVIIPHPAADGVKQMFPHRGVFEIQLDQLVAALPCLVPEPVMVAGVAVKADVEPVLVRAVPFLLLHIPESPKAASHVVEHTVQHYFQSRLVQGGADLLKILLGAKAAVQPVVLSGIVAVGVALKHRIEQHAGGAQFPDMRRPLLHAQDAVRLHPIVLPGCTAQPQRVDLVNDRIVEPHSFDLSHNILWSFFRSFR